MKQLLASLLALFSALSLTAQTGKVAGNATDSRGLPLAGASIVVKSTNSGTVTDLDGLFTLDHLSGDEVTLVVSYIGYVSAEQIVHTGDQNIMIRLVQVARPSDEIVVTASKRTEKITRAPAEVVVVNANDLNQTATLIPIGLTARLQGIEYTRTGVNHANINARGFNSAFNAKILEMTDNRSSMNAGGSGLPMNSTNTTIKEDIERIEIVLGPNSALYGPNAHNGIYNTITKDPRRYQGTTIAIGIGNQSVISTRLRHAMKVNGHWAYKVTGEFTDGEDFTFYDSVYAGGGVYGPAVVIPERISSFRFFTKRTEGHVYYSITPRADLILSGGLSSTTLKTVNNTSRQQLSGWMQRFLQLRYVSPRFFAQVYETWTSFGDTYSVTNYTKDYWNRTHSTITDLSNPAHYLAPDSAEIYAKRPGNSLQEDSRRFNAEAQYNYTFQRIGLSAIAGISYQLDNPKTYGTTLIDANQTFEISQYGAALQLEKTLPWDMKVIAAARLDHHDLYGDRFSPKVGLVKGLGNRSFRLTYGKAYAAPIIIFQRASVFGLVFGNGDGIQYIPNGATLNDAVKVTEPLKPEEISTYEIGYKGNITKNLYIDVNAYYGESVNFISPTIAVSGRPLSEGSIPIPLSSLAYPGYVDSNGKLNGATFATFFNYGKVSAYGADLGIDYFFTNDISLSLHYSYFNSNIADSSIENDANKDGYVSRDERSLNAPKNKVAVILNIQNLLHGKAYVNFCGRWVEQYDMYSGNNIGTEEGAGARGVVYGGINPLNGQPRNYYKNFNYGALGGFTTFDLSLGYRFSNRIMLGGTISNIFNTTQREQVNSPSIGRLYMAELKVDIPNGKGGSKN